MKFRIFGIAAAIVLGIASSTVNAATLLGDSTSVLGIAGTATGIDDLDVGGALYDLEFVDTHSSLGNTSFNGTFGTGALPQFDLGETLGTAIRDALAVFETANNFNANSSNRTLLVIFGSDGASFDYLTYFTNFNGSNGPYNGSRTLNFAGDTSFVVATLDDGTVSTVPLPAGGLLLLTGLAGVAGLKRKKKRAP